MEKKKIVDLLITIIEDTQKRSGEPKEKVTGDTIPIGGLSGFDSQRGIETTIELEALLGRAIPGEPNLFVSPNGRRALRVREIADRIYKLIKN